MRVSVGVGADFSKCRVRRDRRESRWLEIEVLKELGKERFKCCTARPMSMFQGEGQPRIPTEIAKSGNKLPQYAGDWNAARCGCWIDTKVAIVYFREAAGNTRLGIRFGNAGGDAGAEGHLEVGGKRNIGKGNWTV